MPHKKKVSRQHVKKFRKRESNPETTMGHGQKTEACNMTYQHDKAYYTHMPSKRATRLMQMESTSMCIYIMPMLSGNAHISHASAACQMCANIRDVAGNATSNVNVRVCVKQLLH